MFHQRATAQRRLAAAHRWRIAKEVEAILARLPGVKYYTTVLGFSLLSQAQTTYNALFFVTLQPWDERNKASETIRRHPGADQPGTGQPAGSAGLCLFRRRPFRAWARRAALPSSRGPVGPGPVVPDAQTWMRSWPPRDKRPELSGLSTTLSAQRAAGVRQGGPRQGAQSRELDLGDVYKTLQTFMGGYFVNYFNRFGRQWQVYVEAEDKYRSSVDNLGLFYVRNNRGQSLPLSAVAKVERRTGPEFVHALQRIPLRANQRQRRPRLQLGPGHQGAGGSLRQDHAEGDGFRLFRHVLPGDSRRRKA